MASITGFSVDLHVGKAAVGSRLQGSVALCDEELAGVCQRGSKSQTAADFRRAKALSDFF